jgi:LysR family transcriptional regulator of gallate degradation
MRITDLRQLEYFLRVAAHGNISAAAAELNITQPSLTKSIRLLEGQLGVRLFERLARGMEITEYGEALRRHAEAIRVQLTDASSEIAALKSGSFGALSVGAGPSWLRRHLPLAVAETVASHPGLRVRVGGGFDEELFRALRRGEFDFVVAELPQGDDRRGLEVRPLTSDELGVCCRAAHPLGRRRRVAPRDLLGFPWVLLPRTTRAQRRLAALFAAQDLVPPQTVVETSSHAFLLSMLRQSEALTFTTSRTVASEEGAGLIMLNVAALTVRREAGIVLRRGGFLSPAALHLIDRLTAICRADPRN